MLGIAGQANAMSIARQCRRACGDEIASCVADGGARAACRKLVLGQCKRAGVSACGGVEGGIIASTTLTATVVGSTTVDLRWIDNVNRERRWVVERSLSATGGFARIATTDENEVTYRDSGLTPGLTLYYRVVAMGKSGQRAISGYSNVAMVSLRDLTAPSVPAGLTASASGCTQIDLTWAVATDVGGSGLKGYNLYRNGAFVKLVTGLTTSDAGRTGSTAYSYALSAIDNAGNESARSAAVSVSTPACPDTTAPTVPGVPTATASSCNATSLAWAGSTDGGGSGLKGYNVYRNGTYLKHVTGTATTDGSLAASTAYSYAVSAIDNAGNESARSAATSMTTPLCPDATPPTMPGSFAASASGCSQTILSWAASTDSGGSGVKGYNVYRNGSHLKQVTGVGTTDGSLAASTAYSYAVSAVDNAGNESARTAAVSVSTPACADATPPTMPGSVAASATSCSQTSVSWAASTDSGGSGLKGYNVYRNGAYLKQVTGVTTTDGSLAASTAYSYAVSAIDNAGNESARSAAVSATTPVCPDTTAPTVPGGLSGSASSCNAATLAWTASTDSGGSSLKGYNVYRNGTFVKQVTGVGTTDGSLAASTAYGYAVSAIDNAGNESARTAAVSVSTPACADATPPTMPGSVAASATSCSQTSVSWAASTDSGGSSLKGYNVYRNGAYLKHVTGVATTDGSLAASTAYSYAVSAIDNAGNESARSAAVSVTTPACPDTTAPTVPGGLSGSATSCNAASLAWTASTDTGGSSLKGYNVYRNGTFVKQVTGVATTDGSLAASTVYGYAVSAIDNAGNESARTAAVSVSTPACADVTPPTMPGSVAASATSCSQTSVSWAASTDSGGSSLKGYNVYRNGAYLKHVTGVATTDGSLAASTAYSYAVSAIDNAGNESARSAAVSVTTPACPDTTAPTVPGGLSGSATSCNAASLAWTASTDSGGSSLKGYNVYRNGSFLKQVTGVATTDGSLAASTVYGYAVSAIDNAGNESGWSAVVNLTTPACPDTTAPTVPGGLTGSASSCNAASLAWTASTDTGGSSLKGYNVYRNGSFVKQVTGLATTDGSLAASTAYGYAVSAIDNAGNESAWTAVVSLTTPACPDATPPTAPASVAASATSCSQTSVSWAASTDGGGSGLKGYNLYRNNAFVKQVTTTSTTDTGLTASTVYGYAVSAIDNAGNESARSATASTNTPACPDTTAPAVPANVSASASSCSQVGITWSASADTGGSGLKGYNVYRNNAFLKQVTTASTSDAGLTASTTYSYAVAAIDNAGNESARSGAVSAATPACPSAATGAQMIGCVAGIGGAKDVVVEDGLAYVASAEFGLAIADVSNPSTPRALGVTSPPFYAERIAVSGNLAVLTGNTLGLTVVDVTDPQDPRVLSNLAGTMKGVALVGSYAYVILVVPGNPARTDLLVVDLRVPTAPAVAGRVTVATATELRVAGGIVFLAARTAGVQLVDVSNPATPTILGTIDTPDTAKGVAVSGDYLFVADGSKVVSIDLGASPPALVGSLATNATVLTVEGTLLHVIDGLNLKIVDVANPAAPVLRSTSTAYAAQGIDAVGSKVFLASPDVDVLTNRGGLYVIDATTPTAPRVLANLVGGHDNWGVGVAGNIGVVAGNSLGLKVVDLTDPVQPRAVGSLAGTVKGATMAGQYAYVILIVPGNPARIDLAVVDLRTPATPVIAGRVTLPGGTSLEVDGSFAYVSAGPAGLQIVDVSNPAAPRIVGALDTPGTAQAVDVAGNTAYVADDTSVQVVDVTDRTRPVAVGSVPTPATAVAVASSRLYVIGGLQLKIVDVTTPTAPVVRSTTTAYGGQAVQVIGTSAFLATPAINHFDTTGGIYMLDVANPAAPRLVKQIIVPGTTRSLAVAGGRLYAGDSAGVIDVITLNP